ncbi:MAG: hypothetical protein IIB57_01965 [Planctomycetes bacterium]|nr:hypothetical protein [Planctomycetota bacterium]
MLRMNKWSTMVVVLAGAIVLAGSADALAGATLKGKVSFDGKRPKRKVLKMDADAFCKKHHGDKKVGSETAIVNKDKTVRNVIVYIKEGLSGDFPVPEDKPVIDQNGCTYKPHVLTCMVKQTVIVRNSDSTLHNIHGLPRKNAEFNFGQPRVKMEKEMTFTKEEIFRVKCDVHPWMAAWIGVFKHPFHDVTDKEGKFEISGMGAGSYTLELWHETFGTMTADFTVAKGQTADLDIEFEVK